MIRMARATFRISLMAEAEWGMIFSGRIAQNGPREVRGRAQNGVLRDPQGAVA